MIVDVREQTVPSNNLATIVEEGIYSDMHAVVDSIEALQPVVKFKRLRERARSQPLVHHQFALFGVNEVQTVETRDVLDRRPSEIQKTLIRVFLLARRIGDDDHP